jgi:hypothetical protein
MEVAAASTVVEADSMAAEATRIEVAPERAAIAVLLTQATVAAGV